MQSPARLAGRLLRDEAGDPVDRFAAALILLFGQFATTVALLRTGAVTADGDGRVYLSLGETAVRLREPLAHLAVTVADRASGLGSPWLFPGVEGPVTGEQLRQRLARLGVDRVLLARNGARAALAADIPPALLADKLGISISAAVGWSQAAGATRSDYAGLIESAAGHPAGLVDAPWNPAGPRRGASGSQR